MFSLSAQIGKGALRMHSLLELKGVTKIFGGLTAVNKIDLSVKKGMRHAIIGPNGAGKSVLLGLISGLLSLSEGKIYFDGRDISGLKPDAITRYGIGRTFQNVRVFPGLTVLENVMLGRYCRTRNELIDTFFRPPFTTNKSEGGVREGVMALLEEMKLADKADIASSKLNLVDQRRLELARAMATEPKILLLDEPTSGLDAIQSAVLRDLILKINQSGITVLFIAHDISFIMDLAQYVSVLNFGNKIAEGLPSEMRVNPQVLEAYLGAEE